MLQGQDDRSSAVPGFRLAVDRSSDAPSFARHALQTWLAALNTPGQLLDDASLVIGELVTNAVRHAASASLVVAEVHGNRLRLEVHDESPRLPAPHAPDPELGGFGLQLVARIADSWGWAPTPTGKFVWTELA
jgi:anti-sigma regulatory factor (Ser/Thr protein kinase)